MIIKNVAMFVAVILTERIDIDIENFPHIKFVNRDLV